MDERQAAIQANRQKHIMGFTYPTEFRRALAISLGRPDGYASLPEVEDFLREAVTVNVQACMEDHLPRSRPRLKARMTRRSSR